MKAAFFIMVLFFVIFVMAGISFVKNTNSQLFAGAFAALGTALVLVIILAARHLLK